MGALPKKKISRARRGNRRSHQHLAVPQLMAHSQPAGADCPKFTVTHRVCPVCGMYNGNQVLTIKEKTTAQ